jgi:hypothetical protein
MSGDRRPVGAARRTIQGIDTGDDKPLQKSTDLFNVDPGSLVLIDRAVSMLHHRLAAR